MNMVQRSPKRIKRGGMALINEKMLKIANILKEIRIGVVDEEFDLQKSIANMLDKHDIRYKKEYWLGPWNRVDFIVDGVVIEVKKGKPNKRKVISQLERYAAFEEVAGVILVIEKNMDVPKRINLKPCVSIGLNKLWGIAL
jgi:CRISPR/Cas system-associated exonuclease Cas4 (RecB family)